MVSVEEIPPRSPDALQKGAALNDGVRQCDDCTTSSCHGFVVAKGAKMIRATLVLAGFGETFLPLPSLYR
jgi:hypothetical protein